MAEVVFSWGVGEVECIVFGENGGNPCEIGNVCVELSMVFRPMMVFFGK